MNEEVERKLYEDWLHKAKETFIDEWQAWQTRAALAQPEPAAPEDCGEAGHVEGRCGNASCFKPAPTEPAPGWCKHCQQYTIDEPLPAAPTVVEPVAWMSPGRERLEFSRADTVYGSHTIPLYRHPPRTALTEECLSLLDTAMDSLKYHQEQTRPIHLTQVTIQAIQEFLEKHQIGGPRNE